MTEVPQRNDTAPFAALRAVLVALFRAHRLELACGFCALLAVDVLQLLVPRFVKAAIDGLTAAGAGGQEPALGRLALWICLIALTVGVLRFVWRLLILGFSRILETRLRDRLFDHLLQMDRPFYERWTVGDLMAHATNDLSTIQLAGGMGMVAAVDALVMSLAALAFMCAISVKLTLLSLLPMPLLIISTRVLSARLHQRFNLVQERFSLLTEFARATLVAIRMIKACTQERFQERRFDALGRDYVRSNLKVAMVQGLLFPIATLTGNIGMLLVLYFGGQLVIRGEIGIGSFVAFVSYLTMLVWPMMAVGWVADLAQRGRTSLRRIALLMGQRAEVETGETAATSVGEGPVRYECRSLCFTYPGSERPVLHDLSLDIGPGLLGLTGRTGSGKSTLCKLLLRMYPVADGQLLFRGKDVNTLSQAAVREQIAYVGQETVIFSGTIAENIAFGRPEAGMEEIIAAARAAAIDREIRQFADGYQEVLGERGVRLSGGQRQRLALARALLCDRPMLVLDDALSALDVETEQEVMRGLLARIHDKTVIMVSQRVNVLNLADRIVLLDEGRITAQGRHHDLLAAPLYRSMVEKQRVFP
ncbi:MAG: ABC transporter ATP-binding protein [Desulfobulbus sp.]|jgi:ATP-binding cassette subfamily B multidrug efflux pump